jgi:thiosulfate dehydrogenase
MWLDTRRHISKLACTGATLLCKGVLLALVVVWNVMAQTATAPEPADSSTNPSVAAPPSQIENAIARGAYLARIGSCLTCHTAPNGKPMAGGTFLPTSVGTIYSSNITPDRVSGIGYYTFAQFDRVMRQGITADGRHLYSIMPYPAYAKITNADMHDLYTYLMLGVEPVRQVNREASINWPYKMRWLLPAWRWLFIDNTPFKPNPQRDAVWNRGAYLTQGFGHCGSCHTPRGVGSQPKAMSEIGKYGDLYVSGTNTDIWSAPNLRNLWTTKDIVSLLKTGKSVHGVASSAMKNVVHYNTQYMTDADLNAIAIYIQSLTAQASDALNGSNSATALVLDSSPGGNTLTLPLNSTTSNSTSDSMVRFYGTKAGLGYMQFCSTCHQPDGLGLASIFPSLTQNLTVQSADPNTFINTTLAGQTSAQTEAYPKPFTMPSFSSLNDDELTDILNFVRTSWSVTGPTITKGQVYALRKNVVENHDHDYPEQASFKKPRFASMLDRPNAQQLVRGLQLVSHTNALLPNNVSISLTCSSCHLSAGTVYRGLPYIGVSSQYPNYSPRADKVLTLGNQINECFVRSMNGKPLSLESDDMKAIIAYIEWLNVGYKMNDAVIGRGAGKVNNDLKPDIEHGKQIYTQQCVDCHGNGDRGGLRSDGTQIFSPLWGPNSFSIGSGMARLYTAAAFVRNTMPVASHSTFPLGGGDMLSEQSAVDVAAYFTAMPRPDFAAKDKDWPKGGKPKDARY